MRKNRTKHEAKKPRLAKRALALCFALIFVCSCLLPVFAHSEEGLLEPSVSSEQPAEPEQKQDEQQPEQKQEEANASKETQEESASSSTANNEASSESQSTASSDSASSEGSASTAPGESASSESSASSAPGESASSSSASSEASGEPEQPASSETKTEQPASSETKTEETKPTTNTTGDTINQGEATYTYRFWPDKIDAFDLDAINAAVKKGESLNEVAQAQVNMVPCTVLTVMTNANLRDYQANVQQPIKSGYEFAGWYTVDGTTEDEFSFEQNLSFEESKTIDVFAKWNELKAVKSDALSNGGVTVEAKVGPMANVKSVALAEPSQSDAEKLRNSIDKQLYDQSYMVTIFDITPKDKDGMDVEPQNGESVNVEISGLDFSAGDNVWVYHLTNSGRVETLSAMVTSDGGVEFTTKSFSPFAVVKLTEDVSSFGTEDDRLATASISSNYEMTVGGTETLSGSTTYRYGGYPYPCYYHEWKVSNNTDNKITLTANSNTATIQANSAGTVTITHYYGYSRSFYSTETTVVTIKENTTTGQWVYLYAQVEGDLSQLKNLDAHKVANGQLWYTIGRVWVSSLRAPNWGPDEKYVTSGDLWNKVMAALGPTGGNVDRTTNINGKNASINIDPSRDPHVDWSQLGLKMCDGADDYMLSHDKPGGSLTWHLDGKIKVEQMRSYIIKYYDKATGTEIQNQYQGIATVNALIDINGNTVLAPNAINYGGKTYHFVEGNPKSLSITIDEDSDKNIIKLYYEYTVEPVADTITPDTPYINVEKRFTGITEKQIPDDFAIHIGGHTLTKSGLNSATVTTENGDIVLRWKLDDVDVGPHSITETGTDVPGYKLDPEKVTGTGTSVTVAAKEYNIGEYADRITSCRSKTLTATVKQDDNESKFIVISATADTNIILSEYPLSASQRDSVAKALRQYQFGTFKNNSINAFYSIKEATEFVVAGAKVTYNTADGTVTIGATKDWNMVLKLSCKTDKGENPEVKIVNPYTPATLDIQITKSLTTHDQSKKFTFKVTGDNLGNEDKRTLVDENGNQLERVNGFEMTDGKTVTLKNVEAGMHVNVTELDRYDYDVTATNYSTPAVPNSKGEKTFNYEVELRDGKLVLVDSTTKRVVENNHIVVTNTPATTSLTVTKETRKDGAEDHSNTKDFEFTLTLGSNSKGVTWTKGTTESGSVNGMSCGFKLKGGESITFSGINVNDDVTVTEKDYTSEHYTTTVNGEERREKTIDSATLKRNQEAGTTVEFTNAYTTPKLPSMTIQKVVTGAFGERTKEFTFNVKLTDKEGHTVDVTHPDVANLNSFTLKHGKQVTLKEIPIGTTITVTETDANEYKTKATNYDTYVSNRTFVYKVVEQGGVATLVTENGLFGAYKKVDGTAITVENNFDGTPDTGVLLDTLPYLILLAVAVAGGVLVVVRKRKHRDE